MFLAVLVASSLGCDYYELESTQIGIASSGTPTDLNEASYGAVVTAGDFCDG